ncbi:MAG: response regulator transcription factor [Pseudomonadota bacterium]
MKRLSILVADDNFELAQTLGEFFESQGHQPDFAYSGKACLELLKANHYHALVLDVGMPGMSGWEVCGEIRQKLLLDIPIVFLTAYDTLPDKAAGYKAGADDYLGKPFPPEELLMKIEAITKRGNRQDLDTLRVGDLEIDFRREKVSRRGVLISLSRLELALLRVIIRAYPDAASKEDIETTLWPEQKQGALRTHVYRLRRALESECPDAPIIETVYGQGYRFINYGDDAV